MRVDISTLRLLARELSVGRDAPTVGRARALAGAAVRTYWAHAHPGAACAGIGEWAEEGITEGESARAGFLGSSAARLSRPSAAYLLSTFYTLLLPEQVRAEGGVFFTPPPVAERLLDMIEAAGARWEGARVLDPAAGGGAFLAPVAIRMAGRLAASGSSPQEIVEHVTEHLAGIEIDPFSAWMAHVFLEAALWQHCASADVRLPQLVVTADALRAEPFPSGSFDVVLGNPPYGRVQLDAGLRMLYARSLFGHANLYGVFTDLAVRMAREGGIVGYVTPSSFLGGQYFKNLRALLAAEAPPSAIDFITDRSGVFDKVLQETVLVVAARGARPRPVAVSSTQPLGDAAPCSVEPIGRFALPADPHLPWLLPRNREDTAVFAGALRQTHRLRDYGLAVSTGPLVWNRHKAQLAYVPGQDCHPLVWAEAVLPSGEFRHVAERRNHTLYFRLRPRDGHLLTRQPAVLVQRTTAKEQPRRLIAAVLDGDFVTTHGGVVVENHLNVIHAPGGRPRVSFRAVAALLNSATVDAIFRCINGSVAVSAFELESLPLPDVEVMDELDGLLARGAGPAAVERFVSSAYLSVPVGAAA